MFADDFLTACDLTPLAYAQLGTLPQMHRDPVEFDSAVQALLAAARRAVPAIANVPDFYLTQDARGPTPCRVPAYGDRSGRYSPMNSITEAASAMSLARKRMECALERSNIGR